MTTVLAGVLSREVMDAYVREARARSDDQLEVNARHLDAEERAMTENP